MQVEEYLLPDELLYDEKHGWVRVEGDTAVVGLTDFSQKLAGTFVHIVPPRPGKKAEKGKPLCAIESAKWVGRVYCPVSGEIVEVNADLKKNPKTMNDDPYGAGWIAKIKLADPAELDSLMKVDQAAEFVKAEAAKHKK